MFNPAEQNSDRGERSAEFEPVAFKNIELVTPRIARLYGLNVDRPVFISGTDSRDRRPQIYEVGKVVETDPITEEAAASLTTYRPIGDQTFVVTSRPKFGLGYEVHPRFAMSNGSPLEGTIHLKGWMAIIEPLGTVIEHDDYLFAYNRITDKLRVKEIMAHCVVTYCRDLPQLQEGLIIGPFAGEVYKPLCNRDVHTRGEGLERFKFRFPYDGGHPIFEGFKHV